MSVSITEMTVRKQLTAMACALFDIGVLQPGGRMLLREKWSAEQVDCAINWLKRENARGGHIFVRPHGSHALSLVDDLTEAAIDEMRRNGFEPAVITETSLNNFQAWLKHGHVLDHETSTQAAKELARRFGGDPSSADWRHFGRLAGFTNQKPGRRLENGLPPFVKLRESGGRVYRAAEDFIDEVRALALKNRSEREAARSFSQPTKREWIRPLAEFHLDVRYDGDLHRADLAWAIHAAGRGFSEQQIRDEILHARNLSKKGRPCRRFDYAQRTAVKAFSLL